MKLIHTLALLTCAVLASTALAHGTSSHRTPAPVARQQTPWGVAGDARKVSRTVEVAMSDRMRFTPDVLTVARGETVRLRIRNSGAVMHEFVLGTPKELEKHAALMLKFPEMEHDEPYMAHVPPGKTGEIVWTFNRGGDFEFACLIAGHFQAGMKGRVQVR
jgi:uncharacterized cupredoxin-like copper-binding protein